MRAWLLVLLLSGCAAAKKPTSTLGVISTGRDPAEIYDHALLMISRGVYDKALKDLQELRNFHRDDPLSVKAQLAIADVHFDKREFVEARYAYEEFKTYHPRHEDIDYVTWRIGLCIWKDAPKTPGRDLSAVNTAVRTWTGFERLFPDSEHIEEIKELRQKGLDRLAAKELFVAKFYQRREAWRGVEGRATGLLWRYQDSSHVPTALALLAEAYHHTGDVERARQARDRLAELAPEDRLLVQVDKMLAKPAGDVAEEPIFVRPYRIPGVGGPGSVPTAQR